MFVLRRLALTLLFAVCCMPAVAAAAQSSATGAGGVTESDSPINDQGSSYNYRSNITSITPDVPGLSVQVLEFADRLLLTNHTGQTVTIYGYQGEPFARVLANGTAEQNLRSPATYLDTSFYGNVKVPPSASPSAPPQWEAVDRTGQFEWHDHRIHWMSPLTPPQVKNKSKLTLIFDWTVPIEVGARKGAIAGRLYWTPESSAASVTVIIIGAIIVLAGLLFVLFVRRRRTRAGADAAGDGAADGRGDGPMGPSAPREAW